MYQANSFSLNRSDLISFYTEKFKQKVNTYISDIHQLMYTLYKSKSLSTMWQSTFTTGSEHRSRAKDSIDFTNGIWVLNLKDVRPRVLHAGDNIMGVRFEDDYVVNGHSTALRSTKLADGSTGNVISVYYGTKRNEVTALPKVKFDQSQNEFWARFRYRIHKGQRLGDLFEHKLLYAFTSGPIAICVTYPGQGDSIQLTTFGGMEKEHYLPTSKGWSGLFGSTSASADGEFHTYEVHLAIKEGIFQMWIDGELQADLIGLNFGNKPFEYFWALHNHNRFQVAGYHDIYDLVVAVPEYQGFVIDPSGNRRIGD